MTRMLESTVAGRGKKRLLLLQILNVSYVKSGTISTLKSCVMVSPRAQLVLAAPDKVSKLVVEGIVVVLDSVEQRRRYFHQDVVGHLLLLATGITIVQAVEFVCYFCEEGRDGDETETSQLFLGERPPEHDGSTTAPAFHSFLN